MNARRRRPGLTLLVVLALLLAAGAAYALTFGADLRVGIPQGTVGGRDLGGRTIGWKIAGIRGGTAIAAQVNGDPIYFSEVEAELRPVAARYNFDPSSEQGKQQRAEFTVLIVDQLIDQMLIRQEARRRSLKVSEGESAAEMERVRQSFGGEAEFQAALAQRRLTTADVRRIIDLNLLIRRLQPLVAPLEVPEAEIRRTFAARRADYDQPDQVRASHILIRVESPAKEVVARSRAEFIRARLEQGVKFEELARQFSEDPDTKERGGDLGFVARGTLVPEFGKVAFSLKPGEVSAPVKTTFGYHLILVHEKKAGRKVAFEEVRDRIRETLLRERQEEAFRQWLAAVRKRATIKRFDRPTS